MNWFLKIIGLALVLSTSFLSSAQTLGRQTQKIWFVGDTVQFYTSSVYTFDFKVLDSTHHPISDSLYYLNAFQSKLILNHQYIGQEVTIHFSPMPLSFNGPWKHKSDTIVVDLLEDSSDYYIYTISSNQSVESLFGNQSLNKQGSISRGVTVGNSQDLALQSTLNLQLNGQIAPNLYIEGAISDDNVPFEPSGSTQKLQEFDQVYMRIYNSDFSIKGGDFWLKKPTGYFLNYNKRTQGLSFEYNYTPRWNQQFNVAYSKGKFARNIIEGVEGNQGPYQLSGANNEQYIVVLAGTEKVYIDGELLTRGQEFDYIIDYNTAEITFTSNQFITKDKRIIVEFQYSDLNYARTVVTYNTTYQEKNYKIWANYYSEQDAKNQPLQQTLSTTDKLLLFNAGDDISSAYTSSVDSVGYYDDRVLYKLVDTLGYDSVLVYTTNSDSAIYQAGFLYVGDNAGNYVINSYTANGKVFKWVAPVAGVPQGNYEAEELLVAPEKHQMLTVGGEYQIKKNTKAMVELAYSNSDVNTFSPIDESDDAGLSARFKIDSKLKPKSTAKATYYGSVDLEYTHQNFNYIQWYRSAEFDRDWNVRDKGFEGCQLISGVTLGAGQKRNKIELNTQNFIWGNDYSGIRNTLVGQWSKKGLSADVNASWLFSDGIEKTDFVRHDASVSQTFKKFKLGFEDVHEWNRIYWDPSTDSLSTESYQFYDYKFYISTLDSSNGNLELYYRQRHDWSSDSLSLLHSAKSDNFGLTYKFKGNRFSQTQVTANYRLLDILNSELIDEEPENTLVGRFENSFRLLKGVIQSSTYYELGSGLELKKEYIYVEVTSGQGTYYWNDYNADGVRDLDEFEVAQYTDQANYIRTYITSNDYIKVYSNQWTQSLFIKPERVWRSDKGVKGFVARFSNQTVYKVQRKTTYEDGLEAFNPINTTVVDSSLISTTSIFRNTLYFNRINSKFGVDYNYQENASKILLTNGFDTKLHTFHKWKWRWNVTQKMTLKLENTLGRKNSESDYSSSRVYHINYYNFEPEWSYQPGSKYRIAFSGEYVNKQNDSEAAEMAEIKSLGVEFRMNQPKKGSFLGKITYLYITFNGTSNTSLSYEMLEGLNTGNNVTLNLSYQRKLGSNLQLNFTYSGRKSEDANMVHTGGMELRAYF